MIFGVYAIRDVKTGFLTPTVEQNDAVAQRNFSHAVQMSDSVLFSHASDFALFKIGTYNSDTARLEPLDIVQLICEGHDVLK